MSGRRSAAPAWRPALMPWWLRRVGLVGLVGWLWLPAALGQDAAALRQRHQALAGALADSPFGRPLVLVSRQTDALLQGDAYAVVVQPFATVGPALQALPAWCDILILHLNVKACASRGAGADGRLTLALGRKFDEPLAKAVRVDFAWRVVASGSDYVAVQLSAKQGPMGTHDHRIALEAVALDAGRSFVHLSYAHGYDAAARWGMQAYLATLGRAKLGFSTVGRRDDGSPLYVGGLLGVAERNTMRYQLALEAYLGALVLPPAQQAERRLSDWFAATERHPLQLREITRDEYLAMKRREIERQRARPGWAD